MADVCPSERIKLKLRAVAYATILWPATCWRQPVLINVQFTLSLVHSLVTLRYIQTFYLVDEQYSFSCMTNHLLLHPRYYLLKFTWRSLVSLPIDLKLF